MDIDNIWIALQKSNNNLKIKLNFSKQIMIKFS